MNRSEQLAVICSADRIDAPAGWFDTHAGAIATAMIFGFIGFVIGCAVMAAVTIH